MSDRKTGIVDHVSERAERLGEQVAEQAGDVAETVAGPVLERAHRYAHGHDRPLGSYWLIDLVYLGVIVTVLAIARRRPLPDLSWRDILLLGVATHRLSRTLTKDPITSPLRMPFTRFEGRAAPGELHEEVVARGVGHAVGELVTCPFCMAQWVATAFVSGTVFAPRATRLAAACFSAVAVSDFLQYAYAAAQRTER